MTTTSSTSVRPRRRMARDTLERIYHVKEVFNCTFIQAKGYLRDHGERIAMEDRAEADRKATNAALLAAWTHPEGTAVEYTDDLGVVHASRTRSKAWALGGGHPVVLLEGRTGGYCLSRVRLAKNEAEGTAA